MWPRGAIGLDNDASAKEQAQVEARRCIREAMEKDKTDRHGSFFLKEGLMYIDLKCFARQIVNKLNAIPTNSPKV